LIVLDLALGRHDAVEVFDQLKVLSFKGRLLLVSAFDEATLNEVQKICVSRGLIAFASLRKPFRIDDLRERLKSRTVLSEAENVPAKAPVLSIERLLAGGALALWYRRKIDLQSGLACGAEALLYGHHPAKGHVPLADSLPPPESPIYVPLARTALRQLIADWRRCFANEKSQLGFSIRLPLPLITSRGFRALLRENVPADPQFPGFTVNVTDAHGIKNHPELWEVAAQLRLHRIRLSTADIGAAYFAVAHNLKFPFREIRLDADLVSSCLLHETRSVLCRNVIQLAHDAGALACAEGVESLEQVEALIALGCDRAHGPLCGKPQPIDAFRANLRSSNEAEGGAAEEDPFLWPTVTAV
jgi:EAL domain-containing protein (putative c-di-GMP-specific phosphodiesterase class I)